ncbi:MAG: argininosuccinate lyase [Gammaproteobacteria bacterium]
MAAKNSKKWSALFDAPLDARMARFNASVEIDKRLAEYDIAASVAHAEMLAAQGIIGAGDGAKIVGGLGAILAEIRAGDFVWREEDEDVHLNIERRLVEIIGDAGKRLHTARSRNDQVATDLRMFVRDRIDEMRKSLAAARRALLAQAEKHAETLTAGMTHLQIAQPITFGHHLLAYEDMLRRDDGRFTDCRRRTNVLPLGAGALAGVGYPIDRLRTAKALGFDGVCENAMDAVSDRDFAIEFCAACALLMTHLSRFCEEVILWCSPPFGCISLDDSFCTGSSIMPQKKNPDAAELIRGKAGGAAGALFSLLMLMKGQPLAYNKDNQEDKAAVFHCADTTASCLDIWTAMLGAMRADAKKMRALLDSGYPTATELADYLTARGMPFRDAHGATAAAVREMAAAGRRLEEMTLSELRRHAPDADSGALRAVRAEDAVKRRNHIGGTAPEEVRRQIAKRRAILDADSADSDSGD